MTIIITRAYAHLNLDIVIIFYSSKYDGTPKRTIFREDISDESSGSFSDNDVEKSVYEA